MSCTVTPFTPLKLAELLPASHPVRKSKMSCTVTPLTVLKFARQHVTGFPGLPAQAALLPLYVPVELVQSASLTTVHTPLMQQAPLAAGTQGFDVQTALSP